MLPTGGDGYLLLPIGGDQVVADGVQSLLPGPRGLQTGQVRFRITYQTLCD